MAIGIEQLRDYSSIFSRGVAAALLKGDRTALDSKIARYDTHWYARCGATYLQYLRHAYRSVEAHYRNEYVLKNNFLTEWLLRELGQSDSRVFSEFRAGKSVADLVIFNGISKAFEIKTELDSDQRLPSQLTHYAKVFNEVYLIVPEGKVDTYSKYTDVAGLITYNETGRSFDLTKQASRNMHVCAETMMGSLRSEEYKELVCEHYGELPTMTSFTQFSICQALIQKIPNERLNALFIGAMKRRKQHGIFSMRYYRELNQLVLAMRLSDVQRRELIASLDVPISRSTCTTPS